MTLQLPRPRTAARKALERVADGERVYWRDVPGLKVALWPFTSHDPVPFDTALVRLAPGVRNRIIACRARRR